MDDKYKPESLASLDCGYWAYVLNRIKLEGGRILSRSRHEFQADILSSKARHICVIKAAQMAITTTFILRVLWGLIYGRYPNGVIYYFPTTKSVEKFSKTRFGPLIADNWCIRRYIKGTDSVFVKRVGKSILSFEGGRATVDIQGKKDSMGVRSTPADVVIRDERDLFSQEMAEQTNQRIQHSDIQEEVDMGTPTMPDWGIDAVWQKSSQNYWLIKCGCNEWTNLDDSFPDCIHYKDGRAFRACGKCGREIFPRNGEWVAKYPERWSELEPNQGICGFFPSQLISDYIDLNRMMLRFNDPQTNIGEFYNAVLGRAYIDVEDRLSISDVLECCRNMVQPTTHNGPCAMGIDNDKVKHYVIGYRDGKKLVICKIGKLDKKEEFYDLVNRFNVKSIVIDALPNQDTARDLQAQYKGRMWMCYYPPRQAQEIIWNSKDYIVKVNRVEMFDKTHELVRSGLLEIPHNSDLIKEFARQVCAAAKVYETDEITGSKEAKYVEVDKSVGDHWRNALNYFDLACRKVAHIPNPHKRGVRADYCIHETVKL